MDYLIAPGPGDRGTSGPGQRTNGGGGPDPATTINGVVINVNGSNSPALSQVSKDLYTYVTIFEQFSRTSIERILVLLKLGVGTNNY